MVLIFAPGVLSDSSRERCKHHSLPLDRVGQPERKVKHQNGDEPEDTPPCAEKMQQTNTTTAELPRHRKTPKLTWKKSTINFQQYSSATSRLDGRNGRESGETSAKRVEQFSDYLAIFKKVSASNRTVAHGALCRPLKERRSRRAAVGTEK
jgi:hypothetical protein